MPDVRRGVAHDDVELCAELALVGFKRHLAASRNWFGIFFLSPLYLYYYK